jgi:hypothetical protein
MSGVVPPLQLHRKLATARESSNRACTPFPVRDRGSIRSQLDPIGAQPIGRRDRHLRIGECLLVALEPGLWKTGLGEVRFEDLLLVTDEGSTTLTEYPYDLAP